MILIPTECKWEFVDGKFSFKGQKIDRNNYIYAFSTSSFFLINYFDKI